MYTILIKVTDSLIENGVNVNVGPAPAAQNAEPLEDDMKTVLDELLSGFEEADQQDWQPAVLRQLPRLQWRRGRATTFQLTVKPRCHKDAIVHRIRNVLCVKLRKRGSFIFSVVFRDLLETVELDMKQEPLTIEAL
ncbi:hypothetical protein CHS0354_004295 [Potamilus streckersoni]|uniref:Uncharacterized protein n=1 Tax=Potamilus streckersoni TaxID=2493646 RepID=A0AAE0VQB9_9BIVA|nr:hypothetical protein CHS0354_004295 [Potamilus streckersoni]